MRVQILQHVSFEKPAAIEPWLRQRGASLAITRLFELPKLPSPAAFDWLIVLGGPMSVNDGAGLPWLDPERRLVAEAIVQGRTVLGICLGAQLIASALGAAVTRNREREIGWHPVERLPEAAAHPLGGLFPPTAEVFHWHGETFALPAGARHLLRSAGCEHQAFAVGERVLGMQFHLETTIEAARALVTHCGDELTVGPFVQPATTILAGPERFTRLHGLLERVLDALWRSTPVRAPQN